jgi:LacI family transcriptional regulator
MSSPPPRSEDQDRVRAATIVDVAKAAGVSPATVSRVMTNSPVSVASRTRAAVEQAAEELGYRPNLSAQELVRGRSTAIGVVTQHPGSTFFGEILAGIDVGLRGTSYHSFYAAGYWDPKLEGDTLELFLGRRVDGLIILGGFTTDQRLSEIAKEVPLIVVSRPYVDHPDRELRVDNRVGAREAVAHLLGLGHTRIACLVGTEAQPDAVERERGYRDAHAAAGLDVDEALVVPTSFERRGGIEGVERLFAAGTEYTAVFAANDDAAGGAQLALSRLGRRVPEDVSLVGFDDMPEAPFRVPPLTTVRQPTLAMGIAAVEGLMRLIDGELADLPLFEAQLVVRESTAPPKRS